MSAVKLFRRDRGGAGIPVVLVHAIGCDHRMWESLEGALTQRHRVVSVDVRGHGRSPVPPRPYTLDGLADDIVAVLDGVGVERAHYVGLSMGGMIGQALALRHPARLARLVIANSTSSYGPEGPRNWQARAKMVEEGGLEAIREMVAARYFSDAFRASQPDVVDTVMSRFVRTPREGYLGCCDAIGQLDFTASLARIAAPTLVIAGELDAGTPPAMSEAIARAIPGAELTVIPGAAHLAAVEAPQAFDAAVMRFLAAA
ncbi:MAG TPA: 3-oxoadipate enol-lactonase [Usitatibacter sp.]|jgi:3-oxoadipate enol-lactonase|nr:3-oxoadipate enol-lactonase [Usitatibacter sp.]